MGSTHAAIPLKGRVPPLVARIIPWHPCFSFPSRAGVVRACVRACVRREGRGVVSVCGWGSSVINEGEGVSSPPLTAAGDEWRAVCRGRRTPRRGDRVQACFCRSSSARQADGFYPFQVWLLSSSKGVYAQVSPPNPGDTRYTQFMPCHAVGVLATGHEGREISRAAA